MGPSRPDFLCVFSADNRDLSANKQEAEGRWGLLSMRGAARLRGRGAVSRDSRVCWDSAIASW